MVTMVLLVVGFHASDETGENAMEASVEAASGDIEQLSFGPSDSTWSLGSEPRLVE